MFISHSKAYSHFSGILGKAFDLLFNCILYFLAQFVYKNIPFSFCIADPSVQVIGLWDFIVEY